MKKVIIALSIVAIILTGCAKKVEEKPVEKSVKKPAEKPVEKSEEKLKRALKENNELISIFVKSVETAQNNLEKKEF